MSRTHRYHASKGDRAKRGGTRGSKTGRGRHALEAILATGGGFHGKTKKAVRRAERVALKRGDLDA